MSPTVSAVVVNVCLWERMSVGKGMRAATRTVSQKVVVCFENVVFYGN